MSGLRVNIVPATRGLGPFTLNPHMEHDAENVIGCLETLFGHGMLTDSRGCQVLRDPEDQVEDGEYYFTLFETSECLSQQSGPDRSQALCRNIVDGMAGLQLAPAGVVRAH